jgi:mono/diheme cytochrome c family protein
MVFFGAQLGEDISMRITSRTVVKVSAAVMLTLAVVRAQEPAARGGGPGGAGGQGRGAGQGGQAAPAVPQISSRPPVDQAAHDRGRALWAAHCITCHGSQARGSETGPNIIRTKTVNFDRSSFTPGSVLGPFLKAGHPTQSNKPSASFTEEEIVGLAHFLRQRVNDTMRGTPLFTVGDIVVGDAKAGEAYFNGAGGCAACHNATTRSLNGVSARIGAPVDLQQRMLFPGPGARGRGAPAAAPAAPNPNAITVTVTPSSGPAISGVLVEQSDFYVTLRDADGALRVVPRAGAKVVVTNPLQAHIDLLDRITDKQIHDVVAYLVTLK